MNYYVFTNYKGPALVCTACIKRYNLVISRTQGASLVSTPKCVLYKLDLLSNIFVKGSNKRIKKEFLAPCLGDYYIDDLIYELIL